MNNVKFFRSALFCQVPPQEESDPEDGAAVWSQNQPTATKEPSSASDIERDTP